MRLDRKKEESFLDTGWHNHKKDKPLEKLLNEEKKSYPRLQKYGKGSEKEGGSLCILFFFS
jgi:hypothetical protein